MSANPKSALIIGASRGLGLGLVEEYLGRGWRVVATVRPAGSAEPLQGLAKAHGDRLRIERVDINIPQTVAALVDALAGEAFDLLFVNAGISLGEGDTAHMATDAQFIDLMMTNALSPIRVIEALSGLVSQRGTVAVMSSNLASVADNSVGGWETYRASKASLNTFIKSRAARRQDDVTYLCISPGWVQTDMGGANAPLKIGESVSGIANIIDQHGNAGGVHFLDYMNRTINW